MASVISRFVIEFFRLALNFNPEKNKNIVKATKRLNAIGIFLLPHGFTLQNRKVGGVPIEILKKKGSRPKNLVFAIHGGGFIAGISNMYRNAALQYHKACKGTAAVVNIDYRTVPNAKYPDAHEDILKVWDDLTGEGGFAPENTVVVGDSAGGNLALSLMLRLRDSGRALPKSAVLMSPWCDMTVRSASYRSNYKLDPIFGNKKGAITEANLAKLLASDIYAYCGGHDRRDPYLSPLFADLTGLPPTLITVGSHEVLLDEILAVGAKIKEGGADVTLEVGDGMFHCYPLLYPIMPEAKKAFDIIKKHLKSMMNDE